MGNDQSRTKRVFTSRIDWERIKQHEFDRAVESLILRLHADSGSRPYAINGKGGDDGIDVAVDTPDGVVEVVYQLKYFPEGFSGKWGGGRKPQITKSFNTALAKQNPKRWILVMPQNPQIGEWEFVNSLAKDTEVEIDIWGRGQLDHHFAKFPDLERSITRDDTLDYLSAYQAESAAFADPQDLPDRLEKMKEVYDAQSPHWEASAISFFGGKAHVEYSPKHPRAMELEPIRTFMDLSFGEDQTDLRQQIQQTLEYGSFSDVEFPARIARFRVEKPTWAHHEAPEFGESDLLGFSSTLTQPIDPPYPFSFNIVDTAGFSKGVFDGTIDARTGGTVGNQLRWTISPTLSGTLMMHRNEDRFGRIKFKFRQGSSSVRDFVEATDFIKKMQVGNIVELYLKGKRATRIQLNSHDSTSGFVLNEFAAALVEDLQVLQGKFPSIVFVVPENVDRTQRKWLRASRYLLEGHTVALPHLANATFTLDTPNQEFIRRILGSEGGLVAPLNQFPFDWENIKVDLGSGYAFLPKCEVVNEDELKKYLNQPERAIDLSVRLLGDAPAQAWLSSDPENRSAPPVKQWSIPGM